jgi:hypothetical protein
MLSPDGVSIDWVLEEEHNGNRALLFPGTRPDSEAPIVLNIVPENIPRPLKNNLQFTQSLILIIRR